MLADLGYAGENTQLTCLVKNSRGMLTADQHTINALHAATRTLAERGNALLSRVSLCPWRIGAIIAAALVPLHHAYDRTT